MACDPRCLSWFSDDPTQHDCRGSHGRTPRREPDDPVAEGRRDNAVARAAQRARTTRRPNRTSR